MPTYDYRCDNNGQVLEVRHGMQETVPTWGELCALLDMDPGSTPVDSPVTKLATGGQVVKSNNLGESSPPCGSGPCCGGGMCGLD